MLNTKADNNIRKAAWIICAVFTLGTLIMLLVNREYGDLPICLTTFALICIPAIAEKLFSCRINFAVYLFGLLYALCPMLGDCYKLYYTTAWWDKLLHTFGGVIFALFGLYLYKILGGNTARIIGGAVFALCFSMALAVAWEFYEFGCDQLFGTDMQRDTVVSTIHSYMLGDALGEAGSIENIKEVTVNGQALPVKGYMDLGLIDSMADMFFETLGAVAVAIISVLDKGRHPAFLSKAEYQKALPQTA